MKKKILNVYCMMHFQAIKFSGLNTISPSNSVKNKRRQGDSSTDGTMASTSSGGATSVDYHHGRSSSTINTQHPCYKCSSLTEYYAKKLTKKRPVDLLAHSETQLMRVYPASMRIDSSNFNPLNFWSYGVQMAALNYQSDDATATHVNAAMFEQNGRCGYVLKPRVMHDPSHPMYRRFNPTEKDYDGLKTIRFCVSVVSGQYMSPQGGPRSNVYVEIEIIGIPPDSVKNRTKTLYYNSMNPMCNETFTFRVLFDELAFVRFLIVDANTNHPLAQRVVPLKSIRYGYRHVDMRSMQNKPLPLTALFVYTRTMDDEATEEDSASAIRGGILGPMASPATNDGSITMLKRKQFQVSVYGIFSETSYCTFKVTQDSTVADVIKMALEKRGEREDEMDTYLLLEEVTVLWDGTTTTGTSDNSDEIVKKNRVNNKKNKNNEKKMMKLDKRRRIGWKNGETPVIQRVLAYNEKPLEAQSHWPGHGYFVLKKIGDDPSSRAWFSSVQARNKDNQSWDEIPTFLVCIFNVSEERSYVILKVPTASTAQDILAVVLVKARRMENPILFILVEEVEWDKDDIRYRVLDDDEEVNVTQGQWTRVGRFVLEERRSKEDQKTDDDRGLIASTRRAFRTVTQTIRLQRGLAAIGRGWRTCGLPILPGHCLQHPKNSRETVIRDAARKHRKMLAKRERMIRENLERGGSGDGGGGLERGCDDDGSGGEDAEENTSIDFFKSPGRLFNRLWRS